ncbi:serine/threonine-protein kinase [Streptomyces virginiae]|uniref:serine/threonine-protein kinase n=1 Tax=Streptomyces virginiae TaxID=1961 RepID=UPI0022561200|nr:serine/threonine-protein kinase [Streptomyces virginiae]MCX4962327.1 protein kinase [Streptomyces virginiae]MCX5179724.1 protein kinase [Streptomyces virginiae]
MEGTTLGGRYHLKHRLGSGGMGDVWAAVDERMHRPVALKLVRMPPGAEAEEAERRFAHEVRSLGNLPHRHTVTAHDWGEAALAGGRVFYLVMELLRGRTLAQVFREDRPLPWYDLVNWGCQTAEALAAAHRRGILHRDIKPQNVFLTDTGVVKVLDFGLAKILTDSLKVGRSTADGSAMGTFAYTSPEQCAGYADIGPRTDLYSLGCMLYEGLTGRPPFAGERIALLFQQVHTPAPPLTAELAPGAPEGVIALVMRLLAKDPAERPENAAQVVAELRAQLDAHAPEQGHLPPASAQLRRRAEEEAAVLRGEAERTAAEIRENAERAAEALHEQARAVLAQARSAAVRAVDAAEEAVHAARARRAEADEAARRTVASARRRADAILGRAVVGAVSTEMRAAVEAWVRDLQNGGPSSSLWDDGEPSTPAVPAGDGPASPPPEAGEYARRLHVRMRRGAVRTGLRRQGDARSATPPTGTGVTALGEPAETP